MVRVLATPSALGFFNEADKADALMSYLVAYFYGVTVLAGCMFFATLQHWSLALAGARRGAPHRRERRRGDAGGGAVPAAPVGA